MLYVMGSRPGENLSSGGDVILQCWSDRLCGKVAAVRLPARPRTDLHSRGCRMPPPLLESESQLRRAACPLPRSCPGTLRCGREDFPQYVCMPWQPRWFLHHTVSIPSDNWKAYYSVPLHVATLVQCSGSSASFSALVYVMKSTVNLN